MSKVKTWLVPLAMAAALIVLASCDSLVPGPPAVPQNVRASFAGSSVTVTWNAVKNADTYDVCRKMEGYFSSSGSCSILTYGEDVYGTTMSYPESSGNNQTTYTYRVRAKNGYGNSAWSVYSNGIKN